MSTVKKVKSPAKFYCSNPSRLQDITVKTMDEIAEIVGSSYGPGGKTTLIESEYPGIPNTNTKDGVTIFKALGSQDPYKHLIIEQTRDAAQRTASEAGDGTTCTTIMSSTLVKNLFDYCKNNPKESPQRATRILKKIVKDILIPSVKESSIAIDLDNQHLLKKVAQISANGDEEMAEAVIKAFDLVGYGESSHVTIQELSGPGGYEVDLIEGLPIAIGFEESIGKFHTAFINDKGNQRCKLDKPLFLLFDGMINDIVPFVPLIEELGQRYVNEGNSDYSNLVLVAHGFSESVLTQLAFNFSNPTTLNVVPMVTPMTNIKNSRLEFLYDLSAFTGAKIFDMNNQVSKATIENLGQNMESFEYYRFRATVVGEPNEMDIEERAEELKIQLKNAAGIAEKMDLEERLGKLTSGIAKLKIFGASNGELKEKHDRCEDAVCAVRSAIKHGALPGGCRVLTNLASMLDDIYDESNRDYTLVQTVIIPSLMEPLRKLLDNAGYSIEEIQKIITDYFVNPDKVYDIENMEFGDPEVLGIFDAAQAVIQTLENSVSIASVMGNLGGIICSPRDNQLELQAWKEDQDFRRATDHADEFINEANLRG
jgi:chaperonin GroEL